MIYVFFKRQEKHILEKNIPAFQALLPYKPKTLGICLNSGKNEKKANYKIK